MLWHGDGSVANVMVDLDVLVIFEGHFNRKVDKDCVVVNATSFSLSDFDAIKLISSFLLSSPESIVVNLRVFHPDGEDRAAGDSSFVARDATTLPTTARIDKFTIMDFGRHCEGANATPLCVSNSNVVNMQVDVRKPVDGAMELGAPQLKVGQGHFRRFVFNANQVCTGVEVFGLHLGVRQRLG